MFTNGPGKGMRKRSACFTKLLNVILISQRRTPQQRRVLPDARRLAGSSIESKRPPKLERWPDALCNWARTMLTSLVSPDTRSPLPPEISTIALPSLTTLLINPNLAWGWGASGWVKVWLGEPDQAVERFAHAMRLNPIDPGIFGMQQGTAYAHFFADRYDEAITWAKMALRELPDSHAALRIGAASCALAGRDEEAKRLMARLLEIDPVLRISNLQNVLGPWRQPEHLAKHVDALRKAGLP